MSGLETYRALHEEIELIETVAADMLLDLKGNSSRVYRDHVLCFFAGAIEKRVAKLMTFHDDVDGVRSEELSSLASDVGHDIWTEYYARVRIVKDYHRRNASSSSGMIPSDSRYWYDQALQYANSKDAEFSGEEAHGKFVDLEASHAEYLNLRKLQEYMRKEFVQNQWAKHIKKHPEDMTDFESFKAANLSQWEPLDYVAWLRSLGNFELIPRIVKYRQSDYKKFLENLCDYLESFIRKQQPLRNPAQAIFEFETEFEQRWSSGKIPGWDQKTCESPLYSVVTDRLLSNETAMNGHISSKEYRKAYDRYQQLSESERNAKVDMSIRSDREIARLEEYVRYFKDMLVSTFSDTIDHVTRKQARTAYDLSVELAGLAGDEAQNMDLSEDQSELSSSGGEELDVNDRAIYNPKNLPIGPDGKPIPYWQYKLFGLDKEFKCEICGDYSYFGRRAFEKHFSEWRHINGLKALRIQNSNHFFGVTGIGDAVAINDKIRKQTTGGVFNVEREMECEDAMGNVMSYRAYQDLVRQGMI
jgi:splicing factor 3A subunit 3